MNHGNDCRESIALLTQGRLNPCLLHRGGIVSLTFAGIPYIWGCWKLNQLKTSVLWFGKGARCNVISDCFFFLFLTIFYSQIETDAFAPWNNLRRCFLETLLVKYVATLHKCGLPNANTWGREDKTPKGKTQKEQKNKRTKPLGIPKHMFLFISEYFEIKHYLQNLLWFVKISLNSKCSVYLLIVSPSTCWRIG